MSTLNKTSFIRNFAIIAHIDHGKSTLADRLLQACGAISEREMKEQILDNMELERERGITIKAQTVRLRYVDRAGQEYTLNLIDTPGHVDFAYEVSRSLSACEGALLVVDASQGVQAQTLANVYQALEHNLTIIPILNKIDLPAADPERIKQQIEDIIGLDTSNALMVSAKTGIGIDTVLEALVERLPPPQGDEGQRLQALLVDSWYDLYMGVVILVRVKNGTLRTGMKIRMMATNGVYQINRTGVFTPRPQDVDVLRAGEVGFITAHIKHVADCKVGDTITDERNPTTTALPGFKPSLPVVFCGLFPAEESNFEELKESLEKLHLNDASFQFETEKSAALGFGFRCGFLGLLHLEIIQERLEREFDLDLITTAPSVVYRLYLRGKDAYGSSGGPSGGSSGGPSSDKSSGGYTELHNPADMPEGFNIEKIEEPWIKATIFVPEQYLGDIMQLCVDRRGKQLDITYVTNRVMLVYMLPLNEVVFDFYDRLKSLSSGYASFDYQLDSYKAGDLVKVSILINGEPIDALSLIVHRERSESRGRVLCEKLKELIPRQLFAIPIQAAIGGKIIARETISALRKDVTAKCYGGDITRKRKLLEKQKEGKKRLRKIGKIDVPKSVFLEVLKN